MGACVMVCGKSADAQLEQHSHSIHSQIQQQLAKQAKEQRETVQPVIDDQIVVELKSSSLSRSWKTETKSRFFKEKSLSSFNDKEKTDEGQANPNEQNIENFRKLSTKRHTNLKKTSEQWIDEADVVSSQTRSCLEKQQEKAQIEEGKQLSICILGKKILNIPTRGKSDADRRLITSTTNSDVNTLIKEKIVYSDQSRYEGEWRKGMRHGQGRLMWKDGSKYQGEWKENNIDGEGVLMYSDGENYCGHFSNNVAEGSGKYCFINGSKYIGEWINNYQHGKGVQIFPNGEQYQGSWFKGKKSGYGELHFEDGAYYKGQFFNNELHGSGEYNYGDRVYNGQWEHNEKSGQGRMTWKDGNRYEGAFLHDKMNGRGKWYDKGGSVYEGNWQNGRKEGIFIQNLPNGKSIKAEWCFNKIIRYLEKPRTK